MIADTVAKTFVCQYIARFGVPMTLTAQGFESKLFAELDHFLSIHGIRTTPSHSQANDMVERFHRQLKTPLIARCNTTHWTEELPER